jgi:uncharacterized membrane protein HdeD (DUF308 family)
MSSAMQPIARLWWVVLVVGIINVVAGVLAVIHPGFTLLALGIVLGVYLLLAAMSALIDGITGDTESRAVSIVLGVVALIAALICLRRPGDSLLALVVALGIYLIAVGLVRIVLAFGAGEGRGLVMLVGAIDAVLGILLLALPDVSLATLAILVGISMLVRGIFDIVAAFKLHGMHGTAAPPAGAGLAT